MKALKSKIFSTLFLLALILALIPSQASAQAAWADAGSWTPTTDLQYPRDYHTATLLKNNKVLVVGGQGDWSSAEVYDPVGKAWASAGLLHKGREAHTATLLNDGTVLVTGGYTFDGIYLASAELYDPNAGAWVAVSPMHTRRYLHTATLLADGKVLVAGGANRYGYTNSAEIYDPAAKTWQVTGSLRIGRYLHTATLLPDGQVLVAGGMDSSGNPAGAELYNPTTGQWTVVDSLHYGRARHTATLLANGKVLVTGGNDTNGIALASAELFDPATGHWTLTGPLGTARANHTATLLSSGWVLAAGGSDQNYNIFASAELYDPVGGTWVATGSMGIARFLHTATKLANDQVLAVGGFDGSMYLFSAELFTPVAINQSITITTPALAAAVYGATFTVAAQASSGLPVTYSAAGICTNVGAKFTMTSSLGTCTVKYDQAGNSYYNPASQVAQTVTGIPTIKTLASAGAYDGWVLESARTSNKGGSLNAKTSTFQVGDDALNRQYKAILSFDTSTLPAGATIIGLQLRIKQSGAPVGQNPFITLGKLLVDLKKGTFGRQALELGDWQALATAKALGKFGSPVSGWYTAALPATAALNRTGVTQFRLYFTKGDNNNNRSNYMKFFSGNSAINKPQLVITYNVP